MENKLKQLFDYQRFDPSSRLAKLIQKTESHYGRALSDDELMFVAAAGEPEMQVMKKKEEEKKPF